MQTVLDPVPSAMSGQLCIVHCTSSRGYMSSAVHVQTADQEAPIATSRLLLPEELSVLIIYRALNQLLLNPTSPEYPHSGCLTSSLLLCRPWPTSNQPRSKACKRHIPVLLLCTLQENNLPRCVECQIQQKCKLHPVGGEGIHRPCPSLS